MEDVAAKAQVLASTNEHLRTLAPPMPPAIDALLHEEWNRLDPDAEKMLQWMREQRAFQEFAHAQSPFYHHLRGTWAILAAWGLPQDVCRCGLFHSAYSGQVFWFRFFDITDPNSRSLLRSVIGTAGEQQVYNFCSTHRQDAIPLQDYGDVNSYQGYGVKPDVILGQPLNPSGYTFPCRRNPGEFEHMSAKDVAQMLCVTVADIAEQLTGVFTYLDIYQKFDKSKKLWPGNGMPGIGYSVFSKMLKTAAPYLDKVPPIFNNCTELLGSTEEAEARDCYWRAVQEEHTLEEAEQERLHSRAIELNPWIAEPHVQLSQLLFNHEAYAEAVHHAACALDKFYTWGTCWDKRMSWNQWLGFTRMMLLRSKRKADGLTSLPSKSLTATCVEAAKHVTYLQDLVKGFEQYTEVQEKMQVESTEPNEKRHRTNR